MDSLKLSKVESKGYGVIYKLPMQDKDLDVVAKAFYAYICSYAGAGDTAFPGMDKICDDLGVSRQRLERHRKVLVDKGYITITQVKENGRFARNEYKINKEVAPLLQNTTTEKPTTEIPTTENVTYNNNIFNNNSINNNSNIKHNVVAKATTAVSKNAMPDEMVNMILGYFNEKMNKRFTKSDTTVKLLNALYKAGHKDISVYQYVMDNKYAEWINNDRMKNRLVPGTLFAKANFEKYIDEQPFVAYGNNNYQATAGSFRFSEVAQEQPQINKWGNE